MEWNIHSLSRRRRIVALQECIGDWTPAREARPSLLPISNSIMHRLHLAILLLERPLHLKICNAFALYSLPLHITNHASVHCLENREISLIDLSRPVKLASLSACWEKCTKAMMPAAPTDVRASVSFDARDIEMYERRSCQGKNRPQSLITIIAYASSERRGMLYEIEITLYCQCYAMGCAKADQQLF